MTLFKWLCNAIHMTNVVVTAKKGIPLHSFLTECILEKHEDDTKSMFTLVQVCTVQYVVFQMYSYWMTGCAVYASHKWKMRTVWLCYAV